MRKSQDKYSVDPDAPPVIQEMLLAQPPIYSLPPAFLEKLESCSEKTEEKLWQLPIDEDLHKMVCESSVADMNNCVKNRGAGSSLAAAFLEEFVEEGVDWIHLDIAGTSDFSDAKPYIAKGANGVLIRTLGEMFRTVNR